MIGVPGKDFFTVDPAQALKMTFREPVLWNVIFTFHFLTPPIELALDTVLCFTPSITAYTDVMDDGVSKVKVTDEPLLIVFDAGDAV